MLKNNSSSSIDEISKYLRIKNKLQEHIILQLSEELSIFQIAEKELLKQVQILENQKEKRLKIIKQKIMKILVMIITSTIALKIIGTLTLFTFIGAPLLAFVIDNKILSKKDKVDLPKNIEEDLKSTNLALQYIKKIYK